MEDKIDADLQLFKKTAIEKCHRTVFNCEKEDDTGLKKLNREKFFEAYREALQIWKVITVKEKERKFNECFEKTHLFIRLVLQETLHRRKEPEFQKHSKKILDRLKTVEERLNVYLQGVRLQIKEKYRILAEKELKMQNKEDEELRKRLQEQERERNQFPTTTTTITPANPVKPIVAFEDFAPTPTVPTGFTFDVPPPSYPPTVNPPTPFLPPTTPTVNITYPSVDDTMASELPEETQKVETDPFETLSPNVFKVKQISGDGNCAFRAIAQGQANGNLSSDAETQRARTLRKDVCKLLWSKRGEDLKGIGLTVEQLVTMDSACKHDTFRSYLNGMMKSDYAGEVEINLLAESLKKQIYVYQRDGSNFKRLAKYGKDKDSDPILMLWQKGISEAGNHYNLLLRN